MWQKYDYMWLHSASCSLALLLHFSVTLALIFLQDPCFCQCGDSLNSHSSIIAVCLQFVPKTEWLFFPCLLYGSAHGRAWKGVSFHSLQVRQKHSPYSEDGHQWHKFIKNKSYLTLDSTLEHFFLMRPTLHNTPLMFIAQLQEIQLSMLPS